MLEPSARTEGGNRPSGLVFLSPDSGDVDDADSLLFAPKPEPSSSSFRKRFSYLFLLLSPSLYTIHLLPHFLFLISHPNTYPLIFWTPDLDSLREGALGRTPLLKLLFGWIFGLHKFKLQTKPPPIYIYKVGTS